MSIARWPKAIGLIIAAGLAVTAGADAVGRYVTQFLDRADRYR